MNKILLILGLSMAGFAVQAGELDPPKKIKFPEGVLVREDNEKKTKEVFKIEKLNVVKDILRDDKAAAALNKLAPELAVAGNKVSPKKGSELDKTTSTDSWFYWGWNSYYRPYYYNYSYYPYYNYSYYYSYTSYQYYQPYYSYCAPTYCYYYYRPYSYCGYGYGC